MTCLSTVVTGPIILHLWILALIESHDDSLCSLQATWIRNSLLRALRDSARLDTRQSVDNFVYDHPSILRLSRFITNWASGQSLGNNVSKESLMQAMVDKYSKKFPAHTSSSTFTGLGGDVVLVTGTTGALGCYLLAKLVDDSAVSRIYAINRVRRKGQGSLVNAQKSALIDRGLDSEAILVSKKLHLLEADVTLPRFALPEDVYDEVSL
jgi:hypothetical protein